MVDVTAYMGDARSFFEAARSAAQDIRHLERAVRRMESAEGIHGARVAPSGAGRGDAMAATDARIDYEERIARRLDDDYALIDACSAVVYGRDQMGAGGLCALMGGKAADACWWRWGAAETWTGVSDMVGMSERWCRQACDRACDTVDALGFAAVLDGRGIAEG